MASPRIESSTVGNVRIIRWSNPPVNALGKATCEGIQAAVREAKQDGSVQVIVLMPGGEKLPFSAGADIKEFDSGAPVTADSTRVAPLARLIQEVEDAEVPVVAAIRGLAFGGGLELALACHYRLALPGTRFGLPEVKLGIIPGAGGTQRLPRLVGLKLALRMIVEGNPIATAEVLKAGLVDEIISPSSSPSSSSSEALLQGALRFVGTQPRPLVVRRTKDRQVPEFASVRGTATEVCRQLAAKELKMAPKERGGEAQHGCVEAVAASALLDIRDGLALEGRIFARLMQTPQSRGRRYQFFAERMTAQAHHAEVATAPVKRVGVIGGGTMGSGILVAFLDAGVERATLVEVDQAALDKSMGIVRGIFASRVRRGQLTAEQAAQLEPKVRGALKLEALADADLVVEAVFEDMQLKKDIFGRLDRICQPGAILATNTSTLSIDEIASATAASRRPRVLGMHFFSPAHIMKLVELVKGQATEAAAIAAVAKVSKAMRKVCVVVGNCHGFVGNRMLFSYKSEIEFLVEEGACPYRVDKLLYDFGFPVGPFVMADIAGLDVAVRIRKQQGLSDPARRDPNRRFTDLQDRLCEELGRMGQKNGKGWYRYDKATGRTPIPDPEVLAFVDRYRREKGIVPRTDISDREIIERGLFSLVNEGFKVLEEGMAASAGDVDTTWVYGYGFPAFRGGPMHWADAEVGLPKVLSALQAYHRRFPKSPHLQPAALLQELVRKGQGLVARL